MTHGQRQRFARLRREIDRAFLEMFEGAPAYGEATPQAKQRGTLARKRLGRLADELARRVSRSDRTGV